MAGYNDLFDTLNVKTILAAGPLYPDIVKTLTAAHPRNLLRIPDVEQLLGQSYPHYAFGKRFDEAHDEPLLVLHTSGTTALPKPIIITHDWVASWCRGTQSEPPTGTEILDRLHQGNRMLVMMPPFHAGNLMPSLFDAVTNQTTIIFPLPDAVLTPDHFQNHFIGCITYGRADIALLPSAYVHEVAKKPEMLDLAAKHLEYIFYTGGDVAELYGDAVSARVKLFNVNGATEMASFPALRPAGAWDRSIWKYIMPHPITGIDFRCHSWDGGDAKYSAVIVRNKDPEDIQPIFTVYPHLNEYHSGDLYSPHPTIPGLWTYRGRADDCFVLVTGSNINPLAMEESVVVHPEVRAVLMLGQRRSKPGLLIEPVAERELDESEKRALVEKLWPAIEVGNQSYYEAARVTKETVLFTNPSKMMRRAAKGTVQRRPTLDMYAKEIDMLYGAA
jgi:acyl-coenzyme A synthetase/AMP-(fatty) acid ligase